MHRWLAFALLASACASVSPRFDQDVATTFAQDDMRRLSTPDAEIYYPAQHREAAERVAARATECLRAFREKELTRRPRDRALLFLTSANYNNAYVAGMFGGEPLQSVNPLFVTSELFHWFALPGAEAGDVSCHEMLHFAHFEQVEGLWRYVNAALGPVAPSQAFLERWFTEGVAQYYEGRVRKRVGRPHSPLYRAAFDSYVAEREGRLNGGDLDPFKRDLYPYSGAYLVSLPFVEWLAQTYGEESLWRLMEVQGRSIFSPLGVTLRFKQVYGKSIGALVDEWSLDLAADLPKRERRAEQRVLRAGLGQQARLASHPASGTLALVTSGNDEVPTLRILGPDGVERVRRTLLRFGTDREWVLAGPGFMSGLTFSADGRFLWLLNDDLVDRGDTAGQLWKVEVATGEVVEVMKGLGPSLGGALHPGGGRYTIVELSPGRTALVDVRLPSGAKTALVSFPPGVTVSAPAWSPDGRRLVFSRMDAAGWNLVLREADGTLRTLTEDGAFNYGARWVDDARLAFARAHEGRLQVHRLDVDSGRLERLSDTPWGLFDPAPLGDAVAFVNREGTTWNLEVVPATALDVVREAWPAAAASSGTAAEAAATAGADPTQPATTLPASAPADPTHAAPTEAALQSAASTDAASSDAPASDAPSTNAGSTAAAPTPAAPAPLFVERDEPYSSLDGLFVPQLRAPQLDAVLVRDSSGGNQLQATVGASLMGRDRLARHSWLVSGAVVLPTLENYQDVLYRNQQLAPWALGLSASRVGLAEEAFWNATVSAGRSVFTTPVSFGAQALVWQPYGFETQRFIGPWLEVSYSAFEGTNYAGARRGLSLALGASAFPRGLGSSRDMLDLSVGASVAIPLPLLKRHSFTLSVSGRALPGAPADALRVGGVPRGFGLWASEGRRLPQGPEVFLPGGLVEPLRGYEDFAVRATAAAVAGARYRYHFIIDRGFASTLYVLPSLFFRQVDLDLFASGAATDNPAAPLARAAGASVSFRFGMGGAVGMTLYYQAAFRFDFGLPPLHAVGFAFE